MHFTSAKTPSSGIGALVRNENEIKYHDEVYFSKLHNSKNVDGGFLILWRLCDPIEYKRIALADKDHSK